MAKGETYEEFIEKFKPKLTTDDCYTPENIYEAVAGWVAEEYGVERGKMLRPFWPGADYQAQEYPEGCVVVDNPPFSILAKIVDWYMARGVRVFIFAPAVTLFAGGRQGVCAVCAYGTVTYQNGAVVNTGFLTNLDLAQVRTAPELHRRIMAANRENEKAQNKQMPKYSFPDEVVTAALMGKWSKYGVDLRIMPEDCAFVRKLDAMGGKAIFGGGYLLSTRAAAERAAAERAAAEMARATQWELSDRESAIVKAMGRGDENAGMEGRKPGANGKRGAAMADAVGGDGERDAP